MTIEELRVLITAKTDGLTEGVNKVKSKINELRGTTDNMTSSNQRNVDRMKTQYDQLLKKLDNVNARAEIQQRKLDGLREKYSRMSGLGADSPKMIKLQEQILSTENRLQGFINTSDATNAKLTELSDKMAGAGVSTEQTSERFAKLQNRLHQIKERFKQSGNEAQRSQGKIAGFADMINKSFTRILKRIFIYQVIYKLIRSMINYMNGALKTNNQFVSSLNAIKTNLRVAFQPIYDFILPAIQALMRGLATITGYIASFTSALFGKTYQQSYDGAKGIENAKKQMDGLGASAKKAKGQLASFDELNILQTKDDAGGGGGFEMEVPELPEFELGWLDKLKEKLEPTIEAMQRLVKTLEPIKGFMAQGAIDFYNKFLNPVGNWIIGEGLPRFIDALTNGLSKIDWDRINGALARLWEALTPFAINVGEGLLWLWENVLVPLGTWVGNEIVPRFLNILAGAIDVLNVAIEVLKPLGSWLWENFLKPLAKWTGNAVIDMLDGVAIALEKIAEHIEKIPDIIFDSDGFWDALLNVGTHIVTGILDGIYNAIMAIDDWIWKNLVEPIIKAVKKFFKIESPSKVFIEIGENLIEGLFIGISNTWKKITDFFKTGTESMLKQITATWEAIKKKTEETWNNIKSFLENNIWNPIKNTVNTVWEYIKTFVINKWNDIRTGISNSSSALVNAIKSPFESAKASISGIIGDAYNWGKNLMDNIVDGIDSMKNKVKTTVSKVADTIGNFIGFRSPTKEGPGRYADQWMPNMMDMLAEGIRDNVYKIDTSVNMTANSLSNVQRPDNTSSIINAINGALGGSGGDMTVIVKIGEDTITEKVVSNINRQNRISGKTIITV